MSVSRATLRKAIAHRLRQPFFYRLGAAAESAQADSGSTTTLVDADLLLQADDFWNGFLVYFPDTVEQRVISGFTNSSNQLTWLEPIASGVSASDPYELWSTISPHDVHTAINTALRGAWPWFFIATEEQIVIQSDTGDGYDLSSLLTYSPRWLGAVEMEYLTTSLTGTATSGTSTTLVDTNQSVSSEHVGWEIRIYEGTGVGDIRTVSSVDTGASEYTVSSAFSSTPDTTTKYRLVDIEANERGFFTQTSWYTDTPVNPTTLWINAHAYGLEGYVLKLRYEAQHTDLATESATTLCDREWVELRAMAEVDRILMNRAPASELENWKANFESSLATAIDYAQRNKKKHISGTWQERDRQAFGVDPEYPFIR